MPSIADIKAQYPDLGDLDDDQVVDAVHGAFYQDLPREQVAASLGVKPPPAPVKPRGLLRTAGDVGISALKGAIGVPEAAVGLADMVSGGRAGKLAEEAGFRPKDAKAMLDEGYSDQQKQAFQKVQAAQGLGDTFMAAVQNPSVVAHSVVESLPSLGSGGVLARGALALLPKVAPGIAAGVNAARAAPFVASAGARANAAVAPIVAGALGEGVVGAGSAAEQIRQQTGDGLLTGQQSGLALATGALTTGFSMLGGKIAKKLGIADADTMLSGAATNPAVRKGVVRSALEGAVSEGFLEELPQSISEQVLQNVALGRPLDEGVNQAAVLGLLSGGAMGAGANVVNSFTSDQPAGVTPGVLPTVDPVQPAGTLARAAATVAPGTAEAMAAAEQPPAEPTPAPVDDPYEEAIGNLPDGIREKALRAYGVVKRDDVAKGVKMANQKLLDGLIEQHAAATQEAQEAEQAPPPGEVVQATAEKSAPATNVVNLETGEISSAYAAREADRPTQQEGDILNAQNAPFTNMAAAKKTALALGADFAPVRLGSNAYVVRQKETGKIANTTQAAPVPAARAGAVEADGVVAAKQQLGDPSPQSNPNGAANGTTSNQTQQAAPQRQEAPAEPGPAVAGGPGSDAGNGFKRGPKEGERYRVGVSAGTSGVTLEKRLPGGTAATFYVGKDGGLVDADDVDLVGTKDREKLWIPANKAAQDQATAVLEEMGKLELSDPKRASLKKQLKQIVTGAPAVVAADKNKTGRKDSAQIAQPENVVIDRHPTWRKNAIQAGRVAKSLGIDPKGKRLAQMVEEIDAADSGKNQAPAPATPAQPATENVAPAPGSTPPSAKSYLAQVDEARKQSEETAKIAPKEIIEPGKDVLVGTNSAGEKLHERKDGTRYAMRNGRPNFGGDLVAAEAARKKSEDNKAQADAERGDFTLTGSDRAADVGAAGGQRGMFDEAAAPASDGFGEKFTLTLNDLFQNVPYRASAPVPLAAGESVVSTEIVPRKTVISKADQEAYDLPATVLAWRVSAIKHANGEFSARIEPMVKDYGRAPGGEVVAYFQDAGGVADAIDRIAPSVSKIAIQAYETASGAAGGQDAMFSFGGPKAATADFNVFSAMERIKAGDNAETVRRETGWHQGADKKWRFEIDDMIAHMKGTGGIADLLQNRAAALGKPVSEMTVGDIMYHPALFAAYPALANVPVGTKAGRGATLATAMVNGQPDGMQISMGRDIAPGNLTSIMLHELQHGIQHIEGFASGGSPNNFANTAQDRKMLEDGAILARMMNQGGIEEAKQLFARRLNRQPAPGAESAALSGESPASMQKRAAEMQDPVDRYRRLAGEVEARNTQTRQKLTATQRKLTPPGRTADVQPPDVIVMFNGQVMDGAPPPANATRTPARKASDANLVATQQLVDGLKANWTNAPEIIVARNMQDTQIPQSVRDYDQTLKSQGATGEARGFIYQGKVYLLADQLNGPHQIAEVLFHEVLGHYGLRRAFGKGLTPILQQVATMRRKEMQAKAKEYGLDLTNERDRLTAAEEILAEMAQTTPEIGFVKRAIAVIRNWMRANVPGFQSLRLTDNDIIQKFLLPARSAVTRSKETGLQSVERAMGAFNRGTNKAVTNPNDVVGNQGGRSADDVTKGVRTAASQIVEAMAADEDADYALRVLQEDVPAVKTGDTLPLSRRWDDGNATDEELSGTSGAEIKASNEMAVQAAIRSLGAHRTGNNGYYPGTRIVLIKGERSAVGDDPGEVLLRNAEVVASWNKAGEDAHPIIPNESPASNRTDAPVFSRANGTSAWDAPEPSRFDNLAYKVQDKHIDTKRVVESITKTVGQIKDSLNVYLQEELYHGRAARRVADFGGSELKPMLNQMRMAGLSLDDVEEYLHARHAKEANALIASREPGMPDGGSGMTNKAADDYMRNLPADQKRKLEAVAAKVDAITASTRQLYADYGLEDQKTVDGWGTMFANYVPLMREGKDGGMGIGQGFTVKGKEVKGRTGSTRKVVDILANIAAQREKVIVRGEKNRVATALVGLAAANPNPEFWEARSQPPTERVYDAKTDSVIDRPDSMFKQRANVVTAKVKDAQGNVTEQAVVFNEDDPRAMRMAAALKNLDAANLEGLLGVSAKITRYFSAMNTQWNPVFGVVNLVRDVQGAMVNLAATPLAGQQRKIAKDTMSALASIYQDVRAERSGKQATSKWSKLWAQMQEDGGTTGYRDLFATTADRANSLKSIINPEAWADSPWGKVFTANGTLKVPLTMAKQKAGVLFDWLSDYNDAMENGVRLAVYKAALDKGMSREQAASMAKNLTVNFNRKGQIGQQAGALYAFFNAAMQGTARIGQTLFDMDGGNVKTLRLSKTGKAVVYGGVTLGAIQALMLAGAGFDDEDPPEFVRERSLIIPTGGKTYVSIPMPLGLHVIPGIGRHATEFALSGFEKPAKRVVSMLGMLADAFNPIGNSGLSIQTIAPTVIDPLVALTENRDWTGKPIARVSSNKAIPGHSQWKDTATGLSKAIAEAVNWISGGDEYVAGAFSPTPDQIDYLIAQVTGGVGREISKVEQAGKAALSGEELPTYKTPLLGRFYGNAEGQASEGAAFYANVDKLNEIETKVKAMRKDGKMAEASEYLRSKPEAVLIFQVNAAERRIQQLKRDKRELIEQDASREQVRAKEVQITEVMARLNRAAEAKSL